MNKQCGWCKEPFEPKKDTAKYCSDSCRNMAYQKRLRDGETGGGLTMRAKIDIIFNKMQELSMPVLKDSPKVSTVGTVFENQPPIKSAPIPQFVAKGFNYYADKIRECENQDDYAILVTEIKNNYQLTPKQKQSLLNNQF